VLLAPIVLRIAALPSNTRQYAPRLLLIHADPRVAGRVSTLLRAREPESRFFHAQSWSAARALLAGGPFELILLEVRADGHGFAALEQLRSRRPQAPILTLVPLGSEDAGFESVERGAQDFLVEPQLDAAGLSRAIRCAQARDRQAIREQHVALEQSARLEVEQAILRLRELAKGEDAVRLYQAAREGIRARDELMVTVSHDLRGPLASISLVAGMLVPADAPETDQSSKLARQAVVIGRAVRRMDQLIGDLLDIATIESGHLALRKTRTEASWLLADAIEALALPGQSPRLEVNPGEVDLFVDCDRQRILQVFGNLVGNAFKFSTPGTAILLAAVRSGDRIELSVKDRGVGIPAELLGRIFDRFWKGNQHARNGTGLGLAIARGIVEQHGGKLWVESTLGEGTKFTFSLPATA
jgi:signal transduction histidine kinase